MCEPGATGHDALLFHIPPGKNLVQPPLPTEGPDGTLFASVSALIVSLVATGLAVNARRKMRGLSLKPEASTG